MEKLVKVHAEKPVKKLVVQLVPADVKIIAEADAIQVVVQVVVKDALAIVQTIAQIVLIRVLEVVELNVVAKVVSQVVLDIVLITIAEEIVPLHAIVFAKIQHIMMLQMAVKAVIVAQLVQMYVKVALGVMGIVLTHAAVVRDAQKRVEALVKRDVLLNAQVVDLDVLALVAAVKPDVALGVYQVAKINAAIHVPHLAEMCAMINAVHHVKVFAKIVVKQLVTILVILKQLQAGMDIHIRQLAKDVLLDVIHIARVAKEIVLA